MVLVENAARNRTVFYHHDSKDVFSVLLSSSSRKSHAREPISASRTYTIFLKNFAEKRATVIIGHLQAGLG